MKILKTSLGTETKFCYSGKARVSFWNNEDIKSILRLSNLSFSSIGGASVGFQVLNEESRKYFNRAFLSSSSAFNYYTLNETNHLQRMKEFSKIYDERHLIEYLKTVDSDILSKCHQYGIPDGRDLSVPWAPTIEDPDTVGAFITQSPQDIYNSEKAPVMDVMFSFNSKVSKSLNT